MMKDFSIRDLEKQCIMLKKEVISMIHTAKSGHPGGSLSAAEFVTACYFKEMKVDPKNPRWADRDRFVLSKGQRSRHPPQRRIPSSGTSQYEQVPRH